MDLGHIVTSLNKLDAAVEDEQIVLASRDGKTLLIVTYADVARSLEKAYAELCHGSIMPHHGLSHQLY
jgi:PAB-dependent poly(A)-specific ribonuclease subunit 3